MGVRGRGGPGPHANTTNMSLEQRLDTEKRVSEKKQPNKSGYFETYAQNAKSGVR